MALPSVEAVKITVHLLDHYKEEEAFEDAMKLGNKHQEPEDFLREHFAQHSHSEELQDEIAEFFFKILKYRRYLQIAEIEILKGANSPPGDFPVELTVRSSINIAILYLLLFELNSFSKTKIDELIVAIHKEKALMLLTMLMRQDVINKLYELGSQIWDIEYVKEVLKNVLQKQLLDDIYETVTNCEKKAKQIQKKKLTVPIGPKCLEYSKKYKTPSESFTVSIPSKTRIPVLKKFHPVPDSTYLKQSNSENLEKAFERNREEARRKYEEAQKNAFRCATLEKSEKFRKVIEQIEQNEMEKCKIPVIKTSWNKIKFGKPQSPKKTAAVILREGARLLKLEQEEIKRYEYLERGGFNDDHITEWEKEIREESFRKRMEEMEKKHLEVLLSYEEALISRQKYLKSKQEKGVEFRKERENWLAELEILRKEEQLRLQESIEKGKAYGKGAKEAMEHVKEEKHKLALETMEESRILKEKWLKEKEQELQRKVQLIKEIKAIQAFGAVRRKHAISNEQETLGFLYGMSVQELKERLFLLKIELQEELERRRAQVKLKRECRKEIIDSYQELIENHQKVVEERKQRQEEKVVDEEVKNKTKLIRTSSSLDCLRQKLQKKRMERIKQQIIC